MWQEQSSESIHSQVPKVLQKLKQLDNYKLDQELSHEFENGLEQELQHALLLYGHKKSGWRVRLPTTYSSRVFRSPAGPNKIEGDRLKPAPLSGSKRAAAAAVSGGIWILEDESLGHQRFFVLE